MLPELCLGLAMLGMTAYAVLGSADFGAASGTSRAADAGAAGCGG